MTHHQNSGPPSRRSQALVLGGIALVALLVMVATWAWMTRSEEKTRTPAPTWQEGGVSPHAEKFARLEDLRASVVELDDTINRLNDKANQFPQDDSPVNDMDAAMTQCRDVQDEYRKVAASIPADEIEDTGVSTQIGGLDQQADCAPDGLDGDDRLSPPPTPTATTN